MKGQKVGISTLIEGVTFKHKDAPNYEYHSKSVVDDLNPERSDVFIYYRSVWEGFSTPWDMIGLVVSMSCPSFLIRSYKCGLKQSVLIKFKDIEQIENHE